MPARPRPAFWASPQIAAPLFEMNVGWGQTGTTTVTIPLLTASRKMKLRTAYWAAQNATDGAKTCQLKNQTQTKNPTAALTVNGVAALAKATFVNSTTDSDLILNAGDVLVAVYTVTTAGTVQPGEIALTLHMQWLK